MTVVLKPPKNAEEQKKFKQLGGKFRFLLDEDFPREKLNELIREEKIKFSPDYIRMIENSLTIPYPIPIKFIDGKLAERLKLKKEYYIPSKLRIEDFGEWMQKPDKSIDFSEILSDIGKNHLKIVEPITYVVTGDVHRVFTSSGCHILSLIDNQNPYDVLTVFCMPSVKVEWPEGTTEYRGGSLEEEWDNLKDMRICVTGELTVYEKKGCVQLKAKSIKVVSRCSRYLKIKQLATDLQNVLQHSDPCPISPIIRRVGVIGQINSKGYIDFFNHLNSRTKHVVKFEERNVARLDVNLILAEMKALEGTVDVICIVRGGGDPELLLQYSSKEFVNAIASSKTPIITGIAHDNDIDVLLCDYVAHNGGTPTGAAERINKIIGSEKKKEQQEKTNKKLQEMTISQKTKDQIIQELTEDLEKLASKVDELDSDNERLKQELSELKTKRSSESLFSKFFSMFK